MGESEHVSLARAMRTITDATEVSMRAEDNTRADHSNERKSMSTLSQDESETG